MCDEAKIISYVIDPELLTNVEIFLPIDTYHEKNKENIKNRYGADVYVETVAFEFMKDKIISKLPHIVGFTKKQVKKERSNYVLGYEYSITFEFTPILNLTYRGRE